MGLRVIPIVIACILAGVATTRASDPSATIDRRGVIHYRASRVSWIIPCTGYTIMLEGSHTNLTLRGRCFHVALTGSHNDVSVDMARGGWFIITGSHNDVAFRRVERGTPPRMVDRGESNTFHPMPPPRR